MSNIIEDISELIYLSDKPDLVYIQFNGNSVTNDPHYSDAIQFTIKSTPRGFDGKYK